MAWGEPGKEWRRSGWPISQFPEGVVEGEAAAAAVAGHGQRGGVGQATAVHGVVVGLVLGHLEQRQVVEVLLALQLLEGSKILEFIFPCKSLPTPPTSVRNS